MVYILCVLITIFSWFMYTFNSQRMRKLNQALNDQENYFRGEIIENKRIEFWLTIIFVYLFAIVSFRGINVGWDTVQYAQSYKTIQSFNSFSQLIAYRIGGITTIEWGYLLLEWIVSRVFSFQVFLGICAVLYLFPVYLYVKRYSKGPFLSAYIFITYGMYIFGFSTIRQAIAMGIAVLAVMKAHDKKMIKAGLLLALSFSFHRTSLVFIPALFYDKIRLNRKVITLIALIGGVVYWQRSAILRYMLGYARNSGGAVETGGLLQYLFVLGVVILGIKYWKEFKEDRITVFLFICQCFVLIIIPVLRVSPTYFRVYYYNYLFVAIYIPNLLKYIKNKQVSALITIFVLIIGIYYFYNQVVMTSNPLLPYSFFWES